MALFSKSTISDTDGALLQTIASTASEIIQVSRSQEMLAESEEKFRHFFENAQIGMFRSRVSDGRLVECNLRMAEIFGYTSPEECVSHYRAPERYVNPEDREDVIKELGRIWRISNHIVQILTRDGAKRWIQFSGELSKAEGHFEGVVADITNEKLAEERIQASLQEKEILLKEVHHRVKNNMQIIQSLLSLQSNEVNDPEYRKLLADSNSRIKSMALVHEILYQSEDISRLDMQHYFKSIIGNLSRIYQNPAADITISIDIEPVELNLDLSISCGLILNELVTNAYKYAFNDRSAGRIFVSLKKTRANDTILSVADDGPGLPPDHEYHAL